MKKLYTLMASLALVVLTSAGLFAQTLSTTSPVAFDQGWPPVEIGQEYMVYNYIAIEGLVPVQDVGDGNGTTYDLQKLQFTLFHWDSAFATIAEVTEVIYDVDVDGALAAGDTIFNDSIQIPGDWKLSADIDGTLTGVDSTWGVQEKMLCQVRAIYTDDTYDHDGNPDTPEINECDRYVNSNITNYIIANPNPPSSIAHVTSSNVSVYPNPVVKGTDITIENAEFSGIVNVQLFNVVGQLVETVTAEGTQVVIPTSELNSGIYFMEVENNDATSTQKILVK